MGRLKLLIFGILLVCLCNTNIVYADNGHWKKDSIGYYYQYENGTYAKSKWIKENNIWYYIKSNGYMAIGWNKIGNYEYYFTKSGKLETNKWISGRYYVDKDGRYLYGLKSNNIKTRYKLQTYQIANNLQNLSSDWSSFIIATDFHTPRNNNGSQAIINYLLSNIPNLNCFLLGDFNGGSDNSTGKHFSKYIELLKNRFKIYVTLGNHDMNTNKKLMYNTLLKNKNIIGNPEQFYYYFDDSNKKIRYLVLNTSNSNKSTNQMSDIELEWLKTVIKLPNKSWSVVILGHHDIDINANLPYTNKSATEITNIISKCNGKIVGYFCGHEHIDNQTLVNKKFYQNVFYSDCVNVNQKWRKYGSTNDQCITVVSVNSKTGQVKINRIGVNSKIKNYNYKTLKIEN